MILELGYQNIGQQHTKTANEQLSLVRSAYEKLWIHVEIKH
jgi:hypothetical protein